MDKNNEVCGALNALLNLRKKICDGVSINSLEDLQPLQGHLIRLAEATALEKINKELQEGK